MPDSAFKQVIREMSEQTFSSSKFIERQIHAGHPTKLLTMDDSIEFIMVLPGQRAKQYRKQFIGIIKRHLGGDQSLHAEIDANAMSNSPIAQLARKSLGIQAADSLELVGFKRRREELELLALERERLVLEHERVSRLAADYEKMCTNTTLDEQAKTTFKQIYLELLMNKKSAPIEQEEIKISSTPSKDPEQIEIRPTTVPQEIVKRFLSALVTDTTSAVTRIKARELHKKYMDYHATMKDSADGMLNELLFGCALKDFSGVRKTKGQTSFIYTLDHAVIKQSLGAC